MGRDGGLQLFDPPSVLVELHLDDVIEATIDGDKTIEHLLAEAADLTLHFGPKSADLVVRVAADASIRAVRVERIRR